MCGIKADVFGGKTKDIAPEIIHGIEEVLAIVTACTGEIHQQWEFHFQRIIPAAEHIERMSEIPSLLVTIPPPFGIRIGVMTGTAAAVRACRAAGGKVLAEGRGMGNHGGTITRQGEVGSVDQTELYGWEDCKDGKDLLQRLLRVLRGGLPVHDIAYDIPGGNGTRVFRFMQFPIGTDYLFRLLPVFAGGKQGCSGINVPRSQPETIHKVIVRTEGREFFGGGTANEDGQGNGLGKHIPDP